VRLLEALLLAVGLAMDAFAVSVGAAIQGHVKGIRPAFRLWFHFGLFQFLMPVIGWFVGIKLARWIGSFDHWVAFALLGYVGGKMLYAGCCDPEDKANAPDPTRGWTLVALSIATSVDALAVGLSLAMVRIDIWYPSVVIGIVTASLSFCGVELGNRLGRKLSNRAEIVGGLLLIGIGIRILFSR
jgi:manganese efflux pump family protein